MKLGEIIPEELLSPVQSLHIALKFRIGGTAGAGRSGGHLNELFDYKNNYSTFSSFCQQLLS